jgi:transmembrane sensor
MQYRLIYIVLFGVMIVSCGQREGNALGAGTSFHLGKGSSQLFRLPDSSTVVLSPETSIYIEKGFGRDNREIQLDGAALFQVKGMPGRPFVIHTRDLEIVVLGTKFRVDAYRSKAGEEVDVVDGELRVKKSYHSDTDNEPEVLQSGEMVMINRDIDLMEKEKLSPEELSHVKAMW